VKVGQQVAETLHGLGLRRVYGLPGEDHMALLDAFAASGLEYCTAFDETSAVIMAATDAQLTGLPGVAVLSLAPGVSNGVNGLLNTYLEEVPLLLFSGQHPAARYPFVVRQGFNIEQLVTPVTKWQARVTAGMDVPAVLGRAIDTAMSGRRGPVYLELPDGVVTGEAKARPESAAACVRRLRARWTPGTRHTPPPADAHTVARLTERLATAQRPVLVLGGRTRRVTPDTVARFSEALRVPVFTSSRQKGLAHSGSPYFAGAFLNGRLEKRLLDRADLVLMADPESFDFYNKDWCFDADAVAITDEAFTEWLNPFAEQFVAEPEPVFETLTEQAAGASRRGPSLWTPEEVAAYRAELRATLLPEPAPGTGLSVAHAVDAALAAWPRDGYVTADAGFGKPLVVMLSDLTRPDHFFASNALSTMGYSIPAAVAARRAGARPVLSFLGDGSLLMRAAQLMVSAGDGAPAVFVAIMDRALTQIEVKQERRDLRTVGVALPPLSCAKLADAFGIDGIDVESAEELSAAVAKGLRGARPLLIGAHVDPAPSRVLFDVLRG
jgi:acetolactate synthase I/II/III large subunit